MKTSKPLCRSAGRTHLYHPIQDYTLCGMGLEGDTDFAAPKKVRQKTLTCPICNELVRFCVEAAKVNT